MNDPSPTLDEWRSADAQARAAHRALCIRIAAQVDPAPTRAELEEMWRLVARAHNLMVDYLGMVEKRAERRAGPAVVESEVDETTDVVL